MTHHIEVCIDNLESLHNAIAGGATRIELCSSLALGGLTPSFGFMKQAATLANIPVYAMIRPRQGDFLYDSDDINAMLEDIEAAGIAKLQGVVFGVLTADGSIDLPIAQQLMNKAQKHGLGVTFHRAIDQCHDYALAIENIAELGCERVLTSGLAPTAELGIEILSKMVKLANGRFEIMAGAGLTAQNVNAIVSKTGVTQVHLSGKTTRSSKMNHVAESAKMGHQHIDDFIVPVTSSKAIKDVVLALS